MAQTVVDLTLGTIRDLLVEEVKFLAGVKSQVKDVQAELQIMQSFLEEVDRRKSEEPLVLNFVKQIRSLCYRIEDVVDAYVAEEVLRKRGKGIKKILKRIACLLCECKSIHEAGNEIAGIKGDISTLTARMESYGILKSSLERRKSDEDDERKRWRRQTYGIGEEKDFVGMTEDIAFLVAELLKEVKVSKNRVVSICGMGGLGKTTLAKKIYHHKDIRREFETFAWVCVSQNCKPKVIFRDLLSQLDPSKKDTVNNMGDRQLVGEVYEALKNHKCLVVLDDVWALEDWKCLEPAFPLADANSKVLITTRKEGVARVGFVHCPTVLSEDEAWKLLQKKAFIGDDGKDFGMEAKAVEPLGREIVRKCGYLPLAISVLGGILCEKKSLDAWKSISKKIDVHMRAEGSTEKEIDAVLSLSYDDLPYRLKPCFLYLSRFPEDERILIEDLCALWIYEGLVSPQDEGKGETLRDVALGFLNELVSRSLVQLQVDDRPVVDEHQQYCRVHDLLRDLSLKKSKEEEFLHVMDLRGGNHPSMSLSSTTSCLRRLAIYVDQDLDFVSQTAESSQSLRSLFLHATTPGFKISNTSLLKRLKGVIDFNKSNFLRVLYFENVYFEGKMLPTEISKLIHLKLLGFKESGLEELPSWVGDLPFLEAFILDIYNEIKIPNVLWKIKGLKVLRLPNKIVAEEKLVFDGLNELETLNGVNSKTCEITSLSKLVNLRRLLLFIDGNDNLSKFIDSMEASVQQLDNTKVTVSGCDFGSEGEGMSLLEKVFKSNKIFGLSLVELYLVGGDIREDPIGTLEKLSNLRKLVLNGSFVGQEMVCHANGFPQLRDLTLYALSNLEKWRVEEGAMPCLSCLQLEYCPHLDMIPDGIRFITTLHTLVIRDMAGEFEKRVEEGGEDFHKVRHVNSIKC